MQAGAVLRLVEPGEFATFDARIFGFIIPTHMSEDRDFPLAPQSVQDFYLQLFRVRMPTMILTSNSLAPPSCTSHDKTGPPAAKLGSHGGDPRVLEAIQRYIRLAWDP